MLAILTVLNNNYLGSLCHTSQGAKHPGTAHQSEETNILTEEDEISEIEQMSAIVDVYDALTADRCYHKGKDPSVVLKRMLS